MNLEDVSICFEKQIIIDSVNLDINKGEIFVLMGSVRKRKNNFIKRNSRVIATFVWYTKMEKRQGENGPCFSGSSAFSTYDSC